MVEVPGDALITSQKISDQAMEARDKIYRSMVAIARALDVSCEDFDSDEVLGQYLELEGRILAKIYLLKQAAKKALKRLGSSTSGQKSVAYKNLKDVLGDD